MNDALWERFAKNGIVLDDTSQNKVIFETSNNGMGFGKFYIPSSKPYFVPASISADKILTAAERSVIKDVTSELLNNRHNTHEHSDKSAQTNKKSLLGELRHNQDKLSEINKTADLGKNMTKTPEVSL